MAGRRRSILALCLLTSCIFPTFSAVGDETVDYSYDARGRLTKVVRSGSAHPANVRACYDYDKADNRKNVTVDITADCVVGGGGGGPVTFSISSDGPVTEGSPSVFTITKTGTATTSLSVSYSTANGSAVAPGDYTAKSSTALAFAVSDLSKTVSVTTADDAMVESAETFTMSLSSPTGGAVIGTGTATATINDNDSASPCSGVTFSISSNGAVTEGVNSGFTISKGGSTSSSCTINYATANGSAVAPGDYTAKSTTTLTFTSGQSSQTVNVTTIDDSNVESAETFTMNLSSPSGGAAIGTGTATATINDNDSANPCGGISFRVGDAEDLEGSSVIVTISKDGSTTGSCSVSYATADNSAFAPGDYTPKSLTALSFASNETAKTISIFLSPDSLVEYNETFFVNLSSQTGGSTISDAQALITILDATPEQCFDENGQPIPCGLLAAPPPPEEEVSQAEEGE